MGAHPGAERLSGVPVVLAGTPASATGLSVVPAATRYRLAPPLPLVPVVREATQQVPQVMVAPAALPVPPPQAAHAQLRVAPAVPGAVLSVVWVAPGQTAEKPKQRVPALSTAVPGVLAAMVPPAAEAVTGPTHQPADHRTEVLVAPAGIPVSAMGLAVESAEVGRRLAVGARGVPGAKAVARQVFQVLVAPAVLGVPPSRPGRPRLPVVPVVPVVARWVVLAAPGRPAATRGRQAAAVFPEVQVATVATAPPAA